MPITRRRMLSLTALAGLGAWSGAVPGIANAAPVIPPTPVTWITVPDVAHLQAALDAVPDYDGTNLTYLKLAPGQYLVPKTIMVRRSGVYLDASGSKLTLTNAVGSETALLLIKGDIVSEARKLNNVVINGGTWDGNKALYKAVTEYRHAIRIEYSNKITLQNLVAQNAKGDGVYIGSYATPSKGVLLSNVTSTGNHRNGISITSADGFLAENCHFVSNGSTPPMAGACVEPNDENAVIDNITFTGCHFDKNRDRGVLVKMRIGSKPTTPISFTNCTFNSNGRTGKNGTLTGGLVLLRPRSVELTDCQLYDNQRGIFIQGKRPGDKVRAVGKLTLNKVTVDRNLREGIHVSNAITQITATGTKILKNSRKKKNSASNIYLQQKTGLTMIGSSSTGSKGYGLRTNKQRSNIAFDQASYKGLAGNKKGKVSKGTRFKVIA